MSHYPTNIEYRLCAGKGASNTCEEMRNLFDPEKPNLGKEVGWEGVGGREGKKHFKAETRNYTHPLCGFSKNQQDSRRTQILGPMSEHKDAADAHIKKVFLLSLIKDPI